jgi:phosphoglycerate dehydrogenase-like enzyme
VQVTYRPDLLGKPRYIADHNSRIERTAEQEAEWRSLLATATILFDFDASHIDDLPELAPQLRWIQSTSSGIGQFVKRVGYAEKTNWIFTTASGVHARPLAEFAIMAMILFAKNFQYLQAEKEQRHWQRYAATELANKTVVIIGLGKIGQEVARLCKAFDMRTIGTRRSPEKATAHVDELYSPNNIDDLLPQADYLVLATPHTPETEGLIHAERVKSLKQGAVVINIARGVVIDQKAMTEALQNGHLLGAALDVFEREPLPEDDPLWTLQNVIISPHSASTADTENAKITDIFCDNLERFLEGNPMRNVLDTEKLY